MSKLYGYLQGDNNQSITRRGSKWIESILQTSFVRTKTQMDEKGETVILVYKCNGNDNPGDLLSGITIDKEGTVTVHSNGTNP